MNDHFIKTPFIPSGKVSLVLINEQTPNHIKKEIHSLGIKIIENPRSSYPYPAIGGHPDIYVYPLGERKILLAPNASPKLKRQLLQHDFEIHMGNTRIESNYPFYVAYNIASVGTKAFHFWKYTDPIALDLIKKQGIELINVRQGYSKCSTAIVSANSIISEDEVICSKAEKSGMNVLKIRPGHILLPGLNYGFIGGSCGLLSERVLAFTGDVSKHPDGSIIQRFLQEQDIQCLSLSSEPLLDIGSIIPLKELL